MYAAKDRDEIFIKAYDLLDLLVESEQPHEILGVERNMSLQLTNELAIVGKPDLIYRDRDGNLTILDLKTSARSYSEDDLRAVTLQCFSYCVMMKEPAKLVLKLLLKTKEPRVVDIPLNPDGISHEEWRDQFVMVKRAIEAGIRYRVRSFKCATCQYSYACNACEQEDNTGYQKAA
jgi:hypothetical protein